MSLVELPKVVKTLRQDLGDSLRGFRYRLSKELDSPFWKEIRQRPHKAAYLLESISPTISKHLLSLASGPILPGIVESRFYLFDWSEEVLVTALESTSSRRPIEAGQIVSAAEKTLFLFLKRYLFSGADTIHINRINMTRLGDCRGDLKVKYGLSHQDREKMRVAQGQNGEGIYDLTVAVLNEQSLMVAEVSFTLEWKSALALEG